LLLLENYDNINLKLTWGIVMRELILSLVAGIILGIVFKLLRLPLPAPPVLAGILGIIGIYLGGLVATHIFKL